MKPYAIKIKLPNGSTPKTVVARAMTLEDAWHKIEKAHPGAQFINATWVGKGRTA